MKKSFRATVIEGVCVNGNVFLGCVIKGEPCKGVRVCGVRDKGGALQGGMCLRGA